MVEWPVTGMYLCNWIMIRDDYRKSTGERSQPEAIIDLNIIAYRYRGATNGEEFTIIIKNEVWKKKEQI